VCHRDLIDREGRFPFIKLPVVPGHEAAGRVLAVGPAVSDWHPGDRVGTLHRDACGECPACLRAEPSFCERAAFVLGLLADGGYTSHLLAPESALYQLPEDLPAAEAAVLHCTFGSAYRDLVTLGGLRAGQRLLVTGASGGVGSAAVQLGARLGAEVIAVVRSDEKAAYARSLGAAHVVVDSAGAFHKDPLVGRVDLCLDTVGQPTFPAALRALRMGGRLVTVGNIVPEKVALNLGYVITHGLSIIGGSGASRGEMSYLLELHEREPLRVPIERTLPLAQAEEAQRLVRAGDRRGRIVLVPGLS